jgi:ribonuclease HI
MPSGAVGSSLIAHIDGASRGNPGPAAYAVVVEDASGSPVTSFSRCLGKATNNVAEYQALLATLNYAIECRRLRLRVLTDSELMARQIQGTYKVKSADLKPLHQEACRLIDQLESFSIAHVPREQNREADRLANQALDEAVVRAGLQSIPGVSSSAPSKPLRALATYRQGILELQQDLPLAEGEVVELDIRRKT